VVRRALHVLDPLLRVNEHREEGAVIAWKVVFLRIPIRVHSSVPLFGLVGHPILISRLSSRGGVYEYRLRNSRYAFLGAM
jgi:hypothetical protein